MLIVFCAAGFLLFGAVLDAIGNSITLITPTMSVLGTILILILWVVIELLAKRGRLHWYVGKDRNVVITKFGLKPRLFLLGVIIVFWVPRVSSLPIWSFAGLSEVKDDAVGHRLIGLLRASLQETQDAIFNIQQRIDTAEALIKIDPNVEPSRTSYYGLSPLNLPEVLSTILHDGDLYQRTTPSFQRRLKHFINQPKTFQAAFVPGDNKKENMGTLKLLLWELKAQEQCIGLEIEYQSGKLSLQQHEKLFGEVMSRQTDDLLSGRF